MAEGEVADQMVTTKPKSRIEGGMEGTGDPRKLVRIKMNKCKECQTKEYGL